MVERLPYGQTITIHQVDRSTGKCWREFKHYPQWQHELDALLVRVDRAYNMDATSVTDRDGNVLVGIQALHD
jgi:hypothetical protein